MPRSLTKSNPFIPYTQELEREMLQVMGIHSFDELISAIPEELRLDTDLPLPPGKSELEVKREMEDMSHKNIKIKDTISFLGGGSYDHFIPEAVPYLAGRSEFATSYTPYQAEVSQGTLQAIYEYQSMICEITGMEVTNASLYDGASAVAEACLLAWRINKKSTILFSDGLYKCYKEVVKTYLQSTTLSIESIPSIRGVTDLVWLSQRINEEVAAVVVQSPNRLGLIESWKKVGEITQQFPALFIAVGDPISFGMFAPPGECGADIYAGEGQVLGSPRSLGGPYLGLLATRMKYVRKMPGRLVGEAKDVDGKPGFVLVLQTREQHIRRERATSNICTNQGLIALKAAVYLALLGKKGFKQVANLCFQKSHYAAREIKKIPDYSLPFGESFFHEFVVECPVPSERLIKDGILTGIFVGTPLEDNPRFLRIAVTEKQTKEDINKLVVFLRGA